MSNLLIELNSNIIFGFQVSILEEEDTINPGL